MQGMGPRNGFWSPDIAIVRGGSALRGSAVFEDSPAFVAVILCAVIDSDVNNNAYSSGIISDVNNNANSSGVISDVNNNANSSGINNFIHLSFVN